MASLNKAQVIGNVTKDIELKSTKSGMSVCSFGVATNKRIKNSDTGEIEERTEFHNVVLWGKTAEFAANYVEKGHSVFVEGEMRTRSWEDENGNKRYMMEIHANYFEKLTPKGYVSQGSENSESSNADSVL